MSGNAAVKKDKGKEWSPKCPKCGGYTTFIHDLKCPVCDNKTVVFCPSCGNHIGIDYRNDGALSLE